MHEVLLFIHLLGAAAMGFYLLLPFLTGKTKKLEGDSLSGYAAGLSTANRFAQILLVVQFLTGGYLMSQGQYPHSWMAVIIVILVAIGAVSGILGVNLKRLQQPQADEGNSASSIAYLAGKINVFSWIVAVLFLLMLLLMFKPALLG